MRSTCAAFVAASFLVVSTGCGGSAPPAATPPPHATASAALPAPTAPWPHAVDMADPAARAWVHLDFAHLRAATFYQATLALAMNLGLEGQLKELDKRCGFPVLDSLKDAVANVYGDGSVALALTLDVPAARAMTCLKSYPELASASLDDGTPVLQSGDAAVYAKDDVLYMTPSAALKSFVARSPAGLDLAQRISTEGDTVMRGEVKDFEWIRRGSERLTSNADTTALDVVAETISPELAAQIGAKVKELVDRAAPEQMKSAGVKVDVDVQGSTLHFKFAMPSEQTVGMVTALAIYGVRRYLANAKAAAAKETVADITGRLEDYVARAVAAHKPARFPASAPAVPKEIPKATKSSVVAADWIGTWKEIGFSRTDPQYFRYTIVTAPDRKHAVVRAEADLDGDGRSSLLEQPLEITSNGTVERKEPKMTPEPDASHDATSK